MRSWLKTRRGAVSIGAVIVVFITMLIGVSIIGTLNAEVVTAVGSGSGKGNLTGAPKSMTNLVPLFFAIVIVAVGAVAVYDMFKGAS